MRLSPTLKGVDRNAGVLSLDWESLGQLVQEQTLDAVALHFREMGNEVQAGCGSGEPDLAEAKGSRA